MRSPWRAVPRRMSFIILSGSLGLIVFSGCGPAVQHYVLVDAKQAEQRFDEADAVVERHKDEYGERNAVLPFFNGHRRQLDR